MKGLKYILIITGVNCGMKVLLGGTRYMEIGSGIKRYFMYKDRQ